MVTGRITVGRLLWVIGSNLAKEQDSLCVRTSYGLEMCIRDRYDPSFSHYFDLEPSFNPAAVGKQSKLNVTAAYALDMA